MNRCCFLKQLVCTTAVALTLVSTLTSTLAWSQENNVNVSVTSVSSVVFFPQRSAPASVISLNDSQISAEISAVITSINVRVGDIVEQGQLLAQLDCRQTQLNFEVESARDTQLRNALDFDRRELERQETLISGGNIGESAFDRIKTEVLLKENQVLAQQAVLNIAALNVEHCSIVAPYEGVVTERLANEGEKLNPGTPVVQLVQLDELEVVANLALGDVAAFEEAENYVLQENGVTYPLTLITLLPFIENNARIREARFLFTAEQAITGTSGRLIWKSPQAHVPARFLQLREGIPGIFILDNNVAKFIPVPDAEEGRPVAFDIAGSNLLITDGRFGLVDGQALNVR